MLIASALQLFSIPAFAALSDRVGRRGDPPTTDPSMPVYSKLTANPKSDPALALVKSSVTDHEPCTRSCPTIATMRRLSDIEACHERLHRAGWSIGEVGTTSGCLVTVSQPVRPG